MKTINNLTLFYSSREPFSNWYMADFVIDGIKFNCTEQHMMWGKAKLFGDNEAADKILKLSHPRDQKAEGRNIKGFDKAKWEQNCKQIVYDGCKAKFIQNPDLYNQLMATGNTELVEASKSDTIWGIGLDENDPRAYDKANWQGTNYLGEVLTKLREDFKQEEKEIMESMNATSSLDNNRGKEEIKIERRAQKSNISFEEFEKLDIRVCKIISIEKVEKADKLYKMEIDTGIDKRVVVSAIAQSFSEKDLLGHHLPFVLNLEPRKIRGIESKAMIILATSSISKTPFQVSPLIVHDDWPSDIIGTDAMNLELTGAIVI